MSSLPCSVSCTEYCQDSEVSPADTIISIRGFGGLSFERAALVGECPHH